MHYVQLEVCTIPTANQSSNRNWMYASSWSHLTYQWIITLVEKDSGCLQTFNVHLNICSFEALKQKSTAWILSTA